MRPMEPWKVAHKSVLVTLTIYSGGTPSNAAKRAVSACNSASLAAMSSSCASGCIGHAATSQTRKCYGIPLPPLLALARPPWLPPSHPAPGGALVKRCGVSVTLRQADCAKETYLGCRHCRQCLLQFSILGCQCFVLHKIISCKG